MCACACGSQNLVSNPLDLKLQMVVDPHMGLGTNLGPLEEQHS